MATTRTKAIVALGMLDLVRQVAHAWSAREQASHERARVGRGLRRDASRVAHGAREKLPARLEWGMPPWRRTPTVADRARRWGPIAFVIAVASGVIVFVARRVARSEETTDATTTDPKVIGAVRAGSRAIDSGVEQVVHGGSAAATGAASAIAAGSSAVRTAAVSRAREELDERVVQPARHKAIVYGSLGIAGLTAYVVLVSVLTYLVIAFVA